MGYKYIENYKHNCSYKSEQKEQTMKENNHEMFQKFSVAICVYGKDNPEWFDNAVQSIMNQTVKPDEVVIVVDGPVPENLSKIIKKYEGIDCFKVIWFPTNLGHGNARRIGLENTSNELVALMDADDISVSNRFEQQLKYFEDNPELDIVGGDIAEFIDEESNIIGKRIVPQSDKDIKAYLKKRCPFNQVTVMFKKSAVMSVGGYLDWFCEEDYYLWIRMFLNNAVFANTGTVLVNVRVGEDMYSRRGGVKYFISEAKLQKFMYRKGIITFLRAFINILLRLVLQLLMPNWCRAIVFKTLARSR